MIPSPASSSPTVAEQTGSGVKKAADLVLSPPVAIALRRVGLLLCLGNTVEMALIAEAQMN